MSTAFWKRAEELFHSALQRPAEQRPQFLTEACAGEPALLQQVSSLLDSDKISEGYLERGPAKRLGAATPENRIGQPIGPYVVERLIGRGGMGSVYLASRQDGRFEQRVAIKFVNRGMDTEAILARFRTEQQTLANLNHANIAKLYDAGSTQDGLPFLIM